MSSGFLSGLFNRKCCLVFVFLVFLSVNSHANPVVYEVPPLNGMDISKIYGINSTGSVCGKSVTANENEIAIIWSVSEGNSELASLSTNLKSSCWDINDNGQATGSSYSDVGNKRSVRWDNQWSISDMGTLANTESGLTGSESDAYGISNDGTIIGLAEIPNSDGSITVFHAARSEGDVFVDLGTLNDSDSANQYGYSIAYDMNGYGEVVGIAHDNSFQFRPFIHDSTNGMRELPVDTGHEDGEWYATSINDDQIIAGHVITPDNHVYPYYWDCQNCAPVKVTMPVDYPNGEIYAINSFGQMVGMMWSDGDEPVEHAFIFDTVFGLRDLNSLLDHESGWTLVFARDINDSGQVAGTGVYNGAERGYLLDSLDLHTQGDLTNDGSVDLEDAVLGLHLLTSSVPQHCNVYADVNSDNRIGLIDVLYILNSLSGF